MKHICLYFQVHQPFRLRNYSFFEIGNDHYYYNDYLNESILQKVAKKCYLPANAVLLKLMQKHGKQFKVTFSLTGAAIDQFELYAPEVLESFQELAATGNVEFLAETNGHTLASQFSPEALKEQIAKHAARIKYYFKQSPKVFRNTELIYSDTIGKQVYDMGYKGMITEGAKHILGWKSPNYLYYNALEPKMKLLLKNYKLSDDIAFRFSNQDWEHYPLTAEKYAQWLQNSDPKEELINLFMDYETFGEHQWAETGIFTFLEELPEAILQHTDFRFETPSKIIKQHQPVAAANVPYPISWADEERDLSAWLGNGMQNEAFSKLCALAPKMRQINDLEILQDWEYLQASDHFYYMSTKWFSDGEVHAYFNPYADPYEAFINYMNVLSDFTLRVNRLIPDSSSHKQIDALNQQMVAKETEIQELKTKLKKLRSQHKKLREKVNAEASQ